MNHTSYWYWYIYWLSHCDRWITILTDTDISFGKVTDWWITLLTDANIYFGYVTVIDESHFLLILIYLLVKSLWSMNHTSYWYWYIFWLIHCDRWITLLTDTDIYIGYVTVIDESQFLLILIYLLVTSLW
jgi:hypothetical protein